MENYNNLYIQKPFKKTGGQLETLIQCLRIVYDGDIISKSDRGVLCQKGLIARQNGYNIITQKGILYLDEIGVIQP